MAVTSNLATEKHKLPLNASWFAISKQAAIEWADDDAATWSAALTCYTLLALAPLLILAIKAVSVFLNGHVGPDQVEQQAAAWMGPTAGQGVAEIVRKASQPGSGRVATVISLALAIVSAGGVFSELQQAM